jgi:hypothetical protein
LRTWNNLSLKKEIAPSTPGLKTEIAGEDFFI